MVKVKLDEALSESLLGPIRARGHEAFSVKEQGWGGTKDSALWPRVTAEGAFFVTTDKGFGDVRAYPPGSHPGILILRPFTESVPEFWKLLERVLDAPGLDRLVGCISVATPRGVRIRRTTA